jgi:glycosyltransferase involved in cell wall biosynthesis
LRSQDYPSEKYEIIVVDNGSTDATPDTIRQFPVKCLSENKIQSSYAARNEGIRHAVGDIIAFTDSDCMPDTEWIAAGVAALEEQGCDLIGGEVRFVFSPKWSAAEVFDSLTNMQIAQNIAQRQVGKTANLFVRSQVIKEVGLFPDDIRSGGDVIWTHKAVQSGFRIGYAPRAVIAHPARPMGQMIAKQYRVGKGQPYIWLQEGISTGKHCRRIIKALLPTSSLFILEKMRTKGMKLPVSRTARILVAAWICQISTGLGNLNSVCRLCIKGNPEHAPQ